MTGYGFTLPKRGYGLSGLGDEANTGNSDSGGFWDVYANAGVNPAYKGTQLSIMPASTSAASLLSVIPSNIVVPLFAAIALAFVWPRGR